MIKMADKKETEKGQKIDKKDKDGNSPLLVASKGGHVEVVEMLLKLGSSVNVTNNNGETALHLASKVGHEVVVKHLLKAGADPNAEDKSGTTPWHAAAAGGHASLLSLFAAERKSLDGAKDLGNLVKDCSMKRNGPVVDKFQPIEKSEDSKGKMTQCPEEGGRNEDLKSDKDFFNERGSPSFSTDSEDELGGIFWQTNALNFIDFREQLGRMLMDRIGHEAINEIVRGRVDVDAENEHGFKALHLAARYNAEEAVRKLLKRKADVNARSGGPEGMTPLLTAAAGGSVRVIKILIKAGAKVNMTDNRGLSPLHVAVHFRHLSAVKYLLSLGLDPDQRCQAGCTPLHIAAIKGACAIAEVLLEAGASRDIADNIGFKPAAYALHNQNCSMLKILLPVGRL